MPSPEDRLNLPLDALIAQTKQQKRRNNNPPPQPQGHTGHFTHNRRGGGFSPGPFRRPRNPQFPRPAPYPTHPMNPGNGRREVYPLDWSPADETHERSTKLYISNLDYGVTNRDIELLFSEVGELERHSIHYDKSGRSKGTAEVVYKHHSDALAAIERYNNLKLDGKTLEIKLVGHEIVKTVFLPPATNYLREQPRHVFQRLGRAESMGSFRGHGHGDFGRIRGLGRLRNGGERVTTESQQWENVMGTEAQQRRKVMSTESQKRRNVTTENQQGQNVTTENQQLRKKTFYGDTTVTFEDLDADLVKYRQQGRQEN